MEVIFISPIVGLLLLNSEIISGLVVSMPIGIISSISTSTSHSSAPHIFKIWRNKFYQIFVWHWAREARMRGVKLSIFRENDVNTGYVTSEGLRLSCIKKFFRNILLLFNFKRRNVDNALQLTDNVP